MTGVKKHEGERGMMVSLEIVNLTEAGGNDLLFLTSLTPLQLKSPALKDGG
jgi:hypothetical protein